MPKKKEETTKQVLQKLYKKLEEISPKTIYIPAENAKFVELIPSDEIIFIATENAVSKEMDLKALEFLIQDIEPFDSFASGGHRLVIFTTNGKKFYNKDSIGELEKLLEHNPSIIRTHSSFITNLKETRGIHKVGTGRALKMKGSDFLVPVSKSNEIEVKKFFGIRRWPS